MDNKFVIINEKNEKETYEILKTFNIDNDNYIFDVVLYLNNKNLLDINLAKMKGAKEMKKCILVWQVPVIEGEPYNPVEYAVHVRKAKKFAEALNRYFAEKNMDYNCVLDKSACSLDEIFSPQYQAVLFAPEAKTRQWLYKKEVQNETVKKYYLEYMEYNSAQIEKVVEFLSE